MISFTLPSDPGGRRGPSLAVIDTPPAPPGWEDARAQLVRIVDPRGRAVAWLAPAYAGRCVGFAVRPSGERGTEWVQLFHAADPSASGVAPHETGCGVQCTLAAEEPREAMRPGSVWRFIERDPTAAMLATTLLADDTGDPRTRDGGLHLRFSAALTDGTLALNLVAENRATEALRLRLGLQFALVESLLTDAAGSIRGELPGRPLQQEHPDTRVDLPPRAVARLGGPDTPLAIEMALITGVSRLHYVAPGERGIVALLAAACTSSGGILTMEAGASFRLAVALRATLAGRATRD